VGGKGRGFVISSSATTTTTTHMCVCDLPYTFHCIVRPPQKKKNLERVSLSLLTYFHLAVAISGPGLSASQPVRKRPLPEFTSLLFSRVWNSLVGRYINCFIFRGGEGERESVITELSSGPPFFFSYSPMICLVSKNVFRRINHMVGRLGRVNFFFFWC
jgi:hypothetical protein